jgi:hypothetical protein
MTNALKTDAVKLAAFQKATGASAEAATAYLESEEGLLGDAIHAYRSDLAYVLSQALKKAV